MKKPSKIEGQGELELDFSTDNDDADSYLEPVDQYVAAQEQSEESEELEPSVRDMSARAIAMLDDRDSDRYDRYVELGIISPLRARAMWNKVGEGKQMYNNARRDMLLKRINEDMPDGPEKDEKIAEIYKRYPE